MYNGDDAPDFGFDSDEENRIAQELNERFGINMNSNNNTNNNHDKMGKNDESDLLAKKRKIDENSILSEINHVTAQNVVDNVIKTMPVSAAQTGPMKFNYFESTRDHASSTVTVDPRWSRVEPATGSFKYLNVLLPSGRDIKLKMHSKDSDVLKYEFEQNKPVSFLSKPIETLKMEIEAEEEQRIKNGIDDELNSYMRSIETRSSSNCETDLWVEKFRPKDFFDLLSDDGTNRLILTWIKSWDHFVFGKEVVKDHKSRGGHAGGSLSSSSSSSMKGGMANDTTNNSTKKRKRVYDDEIAEKLLELDELNRPKLKVALLSGAPGLGKTTLAQIISKRAGYNCIEMNASDDRSAESFRQYIESATQTRGSVNEPNMKANCLIIDEIDGAPQNAIQVLIDHITETKKVKGKDVKRCFRPIICICNDLYAPSLKQLRQVSVVFQCQAVSTQRLVERLKNVKQICTISSLEADTDGLIALCDKTSNDIRSSVNTLQFLSKQTNRITLKLISELSVGQKDIEKNIFTIMSEVFFKKCEKKDKQNADRDKIGHILSMCQNCDLDRLIQALYENFFFIRFRDSNFESVIQAEDWMMFSDRVNCQVRKNQDYSFMSYQRFVPTLYHLLFSSTTNQINSANKKFSYPHSMFDCDMKLSKNRKIVSSFLNEMSSNARVYYNSCSNSIMDLLPYLNQIIQMNIRPVSIQLLSKNEKERFDSLVELMILFNLNYRQEKTTDGQFGFVLDPPIDELIKLSGMKQHKQLPNMVRQQIAREITISRVKLLDKSKTQNNNNNSTNGKSKKPETANSSTAANKAKAMFNLKSLDQITKEKEIENAKKAAAALANGIIKEKPKLHSGLHNFFTAHQKAKKTQESVPDQPEAKTRKLNDGVWLKYKEGFINAVKYNIKINQLL